MKLTTLRILKKHKINVPDFLEIDIDKLDKIKKLNKNKQYAVRSNCFIEDNKNKSHAGEFDTVLNVKYEDLEKEVYKVKSSYKGKNGSVIIQEMVDSEVSGVMFTVNPIGILSEMVIVYGKGLGCNIVDNRVDTNMVYYDKESKNSYTEINKSDLKLDNKILNKIASIGLKIEKILGYPSDIEYAIKDDEVYILQARPITGLEVNKQVILDNSNIVESYPGIVLDLTQSFSKEIYCEVFKNIVLRLTGDRELVKELDNTFKNMVEPYNGRMYYDITNWYTVLKLLPCSSLLIKIWQKSLGVENKEVGSKDIRVSNQVRLNIIINFLKLLRETPKEMYKLNKYFKKKLEYYNGLVEKGNSIEDLKRVYVLIKMDLGSKWDITLANDMYTFIYSYLANNDDISDIKGMASKKPVIALNKLVKIKETYGLNSKEYRKFKSKFIEKYGDRCGEELKLETKTYRTNPELLDELVDSMDSRVNVGLSNKEVKGYFERKARLGIKNREESRLNRSIIFGIVRNISLKLGEILESNGAIEDKRDIFYLRLEEIREGVDYKLVVSERKRKYANYKKLPTQNRVIFANKVFDKTINYLDIQENINNEEELFGVPTSKGKVVGEVIKVYTPDNNLDVKGKIIVAQSTDPGWVYLIEKCQGIIVERGSLLSHTAIISRELKKPAIVNVRNAMKILEDGMQVELNAYDGKIKVLGGKA